jgi:hypothetical protein
MTLCTFLQMKELKYKENERQRRRRGRQSSASMLMPYNASLIAPQRSAPSNLSGQQTRKLAAEDRQKVVFHMLYI